MIEYGFVLKLLAYFAVGVVQDFLFTMNSKYIALNKTLPAVIYSFLTILMSTFVLYNILSDINTESSVLAIVVYSAGIATGTFVAMKFPKIKR